MPESFESVAIIAIKTIFCANPEKTMAILKYNRDWIIRKSITYSKPGKIIARDILFSKRKSKRSCRQEEQH